MFKLALILLLNILSQSNGYNYEKCSSQSSIAQSKIVQTLNGPIRGECYNVPVSYSNGSIFNYDVYNWLSIPYAEPPINENRFLKPKPIGSWSQVRDTLTWPNRCIQPETLVNADTYSEDCLYLNIFVRGDTYLNRNKTSKPIMVWIHGGSFISGSSRDDRIEPSTLVSAKDVIVVTINYRLNIFGHFHLADSDATGNSALLDQSLAIKWVFDNAKSFGGDPSKITIFGESAGSWSVGFHLFYEGSWPYFRNAILESGAPTGSNNYYKISRSDDATSNAINFLDKIGCNSGTNANRLNCAQSADPILLINASQASSVVERYAFDRMVIDNIVFSKTIDEMVKENNFKKCNIMTGYNSDEFGLFLPLLFDLESTVNNRETFEATLNFIQIAYDKQVTESLLTSIKQEYFGTNDLASLNQDSIDYFYSLIQIQSDVLFVCPALDLAEVYTKAGKNAFAYEYRYRNPASPYPEFLGTALHADEISVVFLEALSNKVPPLLSFNPFSASLYNYSLEDKLFEERLTTYWTDFAKYDDPSFTKDFKKPDYWRPFGNRFNLNYLSAEEKMRVGEYLLFKNDKISMTNDFSSHRCDFWNYTKNSDLFIISSANNMFNIQQVLLLSFFTNFLILNLF